MWHIEDNSDDDDVVNCDGENEDIIALVGLVLILFDYIRQRHGKCYFSGKNGRRFSSLSILNNDGCNVIVFTLLLKSRVVIHFYPASCAYNLSRSDT